jgi:hypothetical protein
MKTNIHPLPRICGAALATLLCSASPLPAGQSGPLTYEIVDGSEIQITDCDEAAAGALVVPAQIEGKPVTSIKKRAFFNCSNLTAVTIPVGVTEIPIAAFWECAALTSVNLPAGLTHIKDRAFRYCTALPSISFPASLESIGYNAFRNCTSLADLTIPAGVTEIGDGSFASCDMLPSISVDGGNADFKSVDGVLYNASGTELIQYPAGKSGHFTVPASVTILKPNSFEGASKLTGITLPSALTSIGDGAFFQCDALTRVEIPEHVTSLGRWAFFQCGKLTAVTIPAMMTEIKRSAFEGCWKLKAATFLGDAPSLGTWVFSSTASGFTVYFFTGSTGFATPTWEGYPATEIDESTHPAARWLASHNLPPDTQLDEDPNGDGVDLLMAWALDLDPNENLAGSMPRATLSPTVLSITHYAANPKVAYTVETSTDMRTWTSAGVTLTGPADNRTATVQRNGAPRRFLRLKVE